MNNLLSDRINNLSTSQTLAMAALARELKAQGKRHHQFKSG
jgi:aspartate aminotransferase